MRLLFVFSLFAIHFLTACGFRVPEIQEGGGRVEGQRLVQEILTNITCDLRSAVSDLRAAYPEGTFLDTWGAQMTLTLSQDEKVGLTPSVLWSPLTPTNPAFSLGAGLNFSSDAKRKNLINGYYLVSDLVNARCSDESRSNGLFLLQSDLLLSQWLFTAVSAAITNTINFKTTPLVVKENVFQHQVTFEITTTASATPTWKLKEFTGNSDGNFFSTSRTRTHDLVITFSPASEEVIKAVASNGQQRSKTIVNPSRQGAELHFSTVLSGSIEAGIRNAFQR
ncbi:hypothetical protein [Methylobacterium bullatum]|uniref:Uncharacterized protein n=1 Tax=Methylobacterium bullatum TaxID=570505 RepID=A0AAV4ZBA0_9HYPH|nr:hypothetical protein [Methylobacterium bullatum]GJD40829.1 hypothetical protein OICFNHDK_3305 [Methylobacterium bullatum]